jgi:hypothetical protein
MMQARSVKADQGGHGRPAATFLCSPLGRLWGLAFLFLLRSKGA